MKKKASLQPVVITGTDPVIQPCIPRLFDDVFLQRDDALLEAFEIPVTVRENQAFGFNHILVPPQLSLVSIASHQGREIQVDVEVAYQKVLELALTGDLMPLCIWATDAVFGYQTNDGSRPQIPQRPNPQNRLIILTQGSFTKKIGTSEYLSRVLLREGPNGEFAVFSLKDFETIPLYYPSPGWDLVVLCAPKFSCITRSVGPQTSS